MTDQPNQPPISELPPDEVQAINPAPPEVAEQPMPPAPPPPAAAANGHHEETAEEARARLERLGGEPAPDITPEEFARLRQSGQIHIDVRGRVRSRQSNEPSDAGISLRKRRAWYAEPQHD
ncbi:MAG: hypothetical protein BroJett018_17110 [Chloroflexota bacterium]|nr:hypothetical protein [Chloroflexota bacterium]GIK63917.1 MAG: hypothetical protein BroJett018_17110 [Chloroflexota bacterium]